MWMKKNLIQQWRYFLPASYTVFILGFFLFPSSKFLSNFFYLAVAFPFVILIFMKKVDLRPLLDSRTFLLITLFLGYMFCTLFWADSLGLSDLSKYGRRVLYILIFLSVTIHLTQSYPTFLQKLLALLCWTAAAFAIAKMLSYYSQHPFPGTRLFGDGMLKLVFRPTSLFGIIAIACTYLALHQRAVKINLLYLGPLLACLSYMVLAQSRGPLLSFTVSMLAWQLSAWLLHKEGSNNHRNRPLVVLALLSVLISAVIIVYPEYFKLLLQSKSSYQIRLEIWGNLLERIENAPWFGHGLTAASSTTASDGITWGHPHSVYVGTLLYGGIVGLLLLIAVVISAIWQGLGRARKPINLTSAIMVLYGAICIAPNGNMLIHHPKPFWLYFWFPLALVVASELPGHPLHSEFEIPKGGGTASTAVE